MADPVKAWHTGLADYFGDRGVVGLQCVTVGAGISELTERLSKAGDYARSYHLHGLAVVTAEALADWVHRRAVRELGLPPHTGKRFSWGYPACPDLAQHVPVFRLLGVEAAIGAKPTGAHQTRSGVVPHQGRGIAPGRAWPVTRFPIRV